MSVSPFRPLITLAFAAATITPLTAAPPVRFASPMQPWASADGEVHLLRPLIARASRSGAPLGSLMSAGWRLVWDGSAMGPGQIVGRLTLNVVPAARVGTSTEVLQIGRSRDPRVVRQCLTYGLRGGSVRRLPDRMINGRRFAAWLNGDAGMSQQIAATDLRAVVDGACYAVERFRYGETASDGDPSVQLSATRGAALLDASLASLQLGALRSSGALRPQAVSLPVGAVAR